MTNLQYSNLSDALLFPGTFVQGGFVFPAPRYSFSQTGNEIEFTLSQRIATTGYFNIDPTVTVSGSNLTVGNNGLLSGTIQRMEFSSSNRGTVLTITDLSLDGAEFTNILLARMNGDNLSGNAFQAYLGGGIGTLNLTEGDDTARMIGFVEYLSELDLGAGNDEFEASRPDQSGLLVDGGLGYDILRLDDFGRPDTFIVNLQTQTVDTGDASFSFQGFEEIRGNPWVQQYIGSSQNDKIFAGGRDDVISGAGGNDHLDGAFGNDTINGGVGNDTLVGGEGNDWFDGGAGADDLFGGAGADRALYTTASSGLIVDLILNGRNTGDAAGDTYSSIELVYGSSFDDEIRGTNSNNLLVGNNGNDMLYGRGGNDALAGGAGNDWFDGGAGADDLFGGAGADRALYTTASSGLIVDLILNGRNTGDAAGDTYSSIELVYGSSFDDEIRGTNSNNLLVGNNGNDMLYGRGGNDALAGGAGNDWFDGGAGADDLFGGAGADRALYTTASSGLIVDLILNGRNTGDAAGDTYSSIELVYGSSFDDEIRGTNSNNLLVGNNGNDMLYGRGGNDALAGGAGNDWFDGGAGADDLFGGAGADRALYTTASSGLIVDLILNGRNTGDAAGDTYSSIELVYGSSFDDEIRGTNSNNLLVGNNGNDMLYGRGGNDALAGGAGNDFLVGGAGNDDLFGGAGADEFRFFATMANDTIFDFANDLDTLSFDDALWGGGLTEMEVVDTFATVVGVDTVFDFGGGNTLTINGITDRTELYDDIEIF